jgi:hypothetical protein
MTTKTSIGGKDSAKLDREERVAAYLDGEVSAAEALEVEAELARDPAARDRFEKLRHDSLLLRAAFDEGLAEPLPERVLQTLQGVTSLGNEKADALSWLSRIFSRGNRGISWPLAVGGSLATFFFGLFVSYQLLHPGTGGLLGPAGARPGPAQCGPCRCIGGIRQRTVRKLAQS